MNNEKMGQFIAQLRKEEKMTQKDLAAKLNITDKAVSKWERGVSCPDISLLSSIADILMVTTSELLNGEKGSIKPTEVEESVDHALHYADQEVKSKTKYIRNISTIIFSILLLSGIVVCAICDLAISGKFTWSLIPISSIIFSWIVLYPVIKFPRKGINGSMVALSFFIIPFLYVLNDLIQVSDLILPIGIRVSIISIAFLWSVYLLFRILKSKKLIAAAISLLLVIPFTILVNFTLSRFILEPLLDVWDLCVFSIVVIAAIALFVMNNVPRKKKD